MEVDSRAEAAAEGLKRIGSKRLDRSHSHDGSSSSSRRDSLEKLDRDIAAIEKDSNSLSESVSSSYSRGSRRSSAIAMSRKFSGRRGGVRVELSSSSRSSSGHHRRRRSRSRSKSASSERRRYSRRRRGSRSSSSPRRAQRRAHSRMSQYWGDDKHKYQEKASRRSSHIHKQASYLRRPKYTRLVRRDSSPREQRNKSHGRMPQRERYERHRSSGRRDSRKMGAEEAREAGGRGKMCGWDDSD